jgi:tetratricopeptide (TPR) repeat protein
MSRPGALACSLALLTHKPTGEIVDACRRHVSECGQIDIARRLATGSWYLKRGQLDRAVIDFSDAIKLNPRDVVSFNCRGKAYAEKGQYDYAIADFDKAIKLDPNNAWAIDKRADAIEKMHRSGGGTTVRPGRTKAS